MSLRSYKVLVYLSVYTSRYKGFAKMLIRTQIDNNRGIIFANYNIAWIKVIMRIPKGVKMLDS
jgi:hypothetical protein